LQRQCAPPKAQPLFLVQVASSAENHASYRNHISIELKNKSQAVSLRYFNFCPWASEGFSMGPTVDFPWGSQKDFFQGKQQW